MRKSYTFGAAGLVPDGRDDRGPAGRKLVEHRDVEVAVDRERERPRDRRRGHDQDVRRGSLRAEGGALGDAEPVLLVHDNEREPREARLVLDERVGPDDHPRLAALDHREGRLPLGRPHAAAEQNDPVAQRARAALPMLR